MAKPIDSEALDVIFREARTHSAFQPRPVDDVMLERIYDLAKLGPTSANTCPMRIVFVKSPEAKQRLKPALAPGNVEKTMAAPVCAIIASDSRFYEYIPQLFPHNPAFAEMFTTPGREEFTRTHAFRNGTLEGAYFILAARRSGSTLGRCRGLTTTRLTPSFSRTGAGSRTFCATSAMAIHRSCSLVCQGSVSTRFCKVI